MAEKNNGSSGLRMALDFGPLLVFFLVNSYAPGDDVTQAVWATIAFMVATAIAMLVSKLKTGRISPMQWFTGAVVAVFGGMTIYLHDETFIQIKPTVIYLMFSGILFFGLFTGPAASQNRYGKRLSGNDGGRLAPADAQLGAVLPGHGGLERISAR